MIFGLLVWPETILRKSLGRAPLIVESLVINVAGEFEGMGARGAVRAVTKMLRYALF